MIVFLPSSNTYIISFTLTRISVYPISSAVSSCSCSSSVSMTWINFVRTWMKPAMSPVSEWALSIFDSGLRRKEAAACIA